MNKAGVVALATISFSLAILCFWISGISSSFIYEPMSSMAGVLNGTTKLNIMFLFAFFILFSFGYAIIASYIIENKKESVLLVSLILPMIITLGLYRTSMLGFFFLSGFAISMLIFINRVDSEKQVYRKIKPYYISSSCMKSAFLMISLVMTAGVLASLVLTPQNIELVMKDSLSTVVSLPSKGVSDMTSTQTEIMYDLLESTESSILAAASIYMSPQCVAELNNAIQDIDKYAKEKIQESVESNAQQGQSTEKLLNMLQTSEVYTTIYKLTLVSLPLAVFAILELFKVLILAPFVGILTAVLTRNLPAEETSQV